MIEELHGIEPIRGYRSWVAVGGEGKPSPLWLSSPQRAHGWADGAISARCPGYPFGIRHDCSAPYLACVCGIYAYNDPTLLDWDQWTRTHEQVFGEVDLWGKVIEAERGYRAEHARVVSLYDTGETSAELAEQLQVPLVSPEGLAIAQARPRPHDPVHVGLLGHTQHICWAMNRAGQAFVAAVVRMVQSLSTTMQDLHTVPGKVVVAIEDDTDRQPDRPIPKRTDYTAFHRQHQRREGRR